MAVSRITSAEEVNQWIDEGLTYKEISTLLQERNSQMKGFSVMSVRRFCKTHGIGKKCKLTSKELHQKVLEKQLKVSYSMRFKSLTVNTICKDKFFL